MKIFRKLGLLTVLFCCLNNVLGQKIIKAKKVKLYNGLVCYEKSRDPFTGIITDDYYGFFGIWLENDGTKNSQYVAQEITKAIGLCFEYSGEKIFKHTESSFKDGKLDGLTAFWSNKKSDLVSNLNFKNGELDGISSIWDNRGNQVFKGSFKNGRKEGLHIYWNENGDWTSIKNYDADRETCLEKEDLSQEIRDLLPNKITQGHTRNSNNGEVLYRNTSILFSGIYQEYYLNGKLELEFNYKNGKKEGLCREWYSDGKQRFDGTYKNEKKEGLHIYWNGFGDWTSIKNYDADRETYLKKEDLSQEIRDLLPNKIKQRHTRNSNNGEVLYKNTSILFSGICQEYYSKGKLESEFNYKNGKKEGMCREWYSDGKLESEFNYKDNKKEGMCREWYSDGNQKFEGNFKNNLKDSLCIEWDENGIMDLTKYENGEEIPILKDDLNQKLLNKLNIPSSVNFSDLIERSDIYYYKDFKSITFSGRIKELYDNGKLKLDFNFLNGTIILQKWYFANGILAELADYEKREFKVYHKNGKLRYDSESKVTGNYSIDYEKYSSDIDKDIYNIYTHYHDRKGWHKEYHENGILYKQFKIIESIDKNSYLSHNLDSTYKEWYSNGLHSKEFNYINGKLEGSYKEWHDNGKLDIQTSYINNKKEGSYKEWHDNGRLQIQTSYVNGNKEGSYKEWYDNGRLHIQTSYINGKKEGSYKYWSYDGSYTDTKKYRSGVEY